MRQEQIISISNSPYAVAHTTFIPLPYQYLELYTHRMSPSRDEPKATSNGTKFQVKGFNLAAKNGKKSQPKPGSHLGKRSRTGFGREDSDGEDEERKVMDEMVTGFGAEGAIKIGQEKKKAEPLIIPGIKNKNWKEEARMRRGGGKNLLPPEVQAQRAARNGGEGKAEGVDVVNSNDGAIQWGLSVRKRVKVEAGQVDNGSKEIEEEGVEKEVVVQVKPQTADEEALAALLGEEKEKKKEDLVIPSTHDSEPQHYEHVSEQDAYKKAVAQAPESSTLEDYERVPVEEFGAALLRGMGWDGKERGKVRDVKRRGNLLGLGAKEEKGAEELGAWVGRSDIKALRRGGKNGGGERRPKAGEYKRGEEEKRRGREERGGGSYREEREREREYERDGRYRESRDSGRDSGRERERDRRR